MSDCCVCGVEVVGHGHNPRPISGDKCCGLCNTKVVLPLRMSLMVDIKGDEKMTKKSENEKEEKTEAERQEKQYISEEVE